MGVPARRRLTRRPRAVPADGPRRHDTLARNPAHQEPAGRDRCHAAAQLQKPPRGPEGQRLAIGASCRVRQPDQRRRRPIERNRAAVAACHPPRPPSGGVGRHQRPCRRVEHERERGPRILAGLQIGRKRFGARRHMSRLGDNSEPGEGTNPLGFSPLHRHCRPCRSSRRRDGASISCLQAAKRAEVASTQVRPGTAMAGARKIRCNRASGPHCTASCQRPVSGKPAGHRFESPEP
jgi:hypothetical protein